MLKPSFKSELINSADTIDLRARILRPGQPLELCHYAEDNFASTFHLGIRGVTGKIICNGTFIQQPHEYFNSSLKPYRLRGMATEPLYQKQGLGKLVVGNAIQILKEKTCDLLWFNARISAENFYTKLDFSAMGTVFDIPLIGPHKVMYKWL